MQNINHAGCLFFGMVMMFDGVDSDGYNVVMMLVMVMVVVTVVMGLTG